MFHYHDIIFSCCICYVIQKRVERGLIHSSEHTFKIFNILFTFLSCSMKLEKYFPRILHTYRYLRRYRMVTKQLSTIMKVQGQDTTTNSQEGTEQLAQQGRKRETALKILREIVLKFLQTQDFLNECQLEEKEKEKDREVAQMQHTFANMNMKANE
jgi:hypothetical protein